ncbi:hypothetical protein WA026_007046 [Henosepilachna vigintioctopunctata]|uniref:Uncharacterized protein n=1 Tax=Henosepilachna vigintioctopunctata TaxID=420089 RepID=A0AAW1VBJ2_9CUCU
MKHSNNSSTNCLKYGLKCSILKQILRTVKNQRGEQAQKSRHNQKIPIEYPDYEKDLVQPS